LDNEAYVVQYVELDKRPRTKPGKSVQSAPGGRVSLLPVSAA
jgi:hypothetical protein